MRLKIFLMFNRLVLHVHVRCNTSCVMHLCMSVFYNYIHAYVHVHVLIYTHTAVCSLALLAITAIYIV